jgi:hypothetical protein
MIVFPPGELACVITGSSILKLKREDPPLIPRAVGDGSNRRSDHAAMAASQSGANGGRTSRWSFGSAAMAARS